MDTFMGYEREDGQVGIRNHVAVLPSVACANGVVSMIAREVPGVVPLYHSHGCGRGGSDMMMHSRVLQNLCKNPNFAAVLVVGLGCEVIKSEGVAIPAQLAKRQVKQIIIQQEGGSQKTARKGIDIVKRLLEDAKREKKKGVPGKQPYYRPGMRRF